MPEQTLAIIKPNAVANKVTGRILSMWEEAGFRILALKQVRLTGPQAAGFYREHEGKPFYEGLVEFMTSGPVILLVLSRAGAVEANRELMGATDPDAAAPGTIRKLFGQSVRHNAVHGSDSPESAQREIAYFFNALEVSRS